MGGVASATVLVAAAAFPCSSLLGRTDCRRVFCIRMPPRDRTTLLPAVVLDILGHRRLARERWWHLSLLLLSCIGIHSSRGAGAGVGAGEETGAGIMAASTTIRGFMSTACDNLVCINHVDISITVRNTLLREGRCKRQIQF